MKCKICFFSRFLFSVITGYFLTCFTLVMATETAEVSFSGTLLESPPCVVNSNRDIVVDFGDEVMTTRIDGTQYRQKIEFTIDCTSAISSKQKIRISGTTTSAGYAGEVISTPKKGLGIALYHDSVRYSPGEWLNFNVPNIPTFYAVPEKNKSEAMSGGVFNAKASLVVEYQ
ncbi:fimbrial protein [Pantoea ananatis]|uniref:fimbrial protein n=1 Tax=Pantoea ananas TaxID=553 RepID=UPI00207B08EB|nr:fimbrial protein [Pantoea ananatis]MCW0355037.1 hypothetical protein [Pantoea ananatis]USL57214.1 fimbrial protein [Pantoea ananatis]